MTQSYNISHGLFGTQHLEALVARLNELGIASPQQIEQARQEQAKTGERFGVLLARHGMIRDADSGRRLAFQLGWVGRPLDPSQINRAVSQQIPVELCRSHRIAPIQQGHDGRVVLASDDPFTLFALESLERRLQMRFEMLLIREQDMDTLLAGLDQQPSVSVVSSQPAQASLSQATEAISEQATAADEPIIRLVDSLLRQAVQMRASDVHIEPLADCVKVRYRIDGVLHEVNNPPKGLQGPITSRIKIMSGLNIAEKRLPQDGRLQFSVDEKSLDVRISTLPALHGESVVMRLLDRSQSVRGLEELGLMAQQAQWEQLIRRPYGMVLVTGPTGSGKTTTLYTTLASLNRPDRKLITVEDPVEYRLGGVNQVQVKPAIGLSFAAGLRAMLRQAPDVIMVGEIRDQETAQIAIQAALTGHLVFSTLHTNDAPSAVTRLVDMGIAAFLVASTVQGVLAQRLVRRICPSCKIQRPPTAEERAFLGEPAVGEVCEGRGCPPCQNTGLFGRIGIYELLCLSDSLRQLVMAKHPSSSLKRQAIQEGMRALREDGRLKVREGLTTMAEILRATPEE